MYTLPVRFPSDLYEKLQALAGLTGKPMAELVRASVKEKIDSQPKKVQKQLKYVNPLTEMMKKMQKLPPAKDHYPNLSIDEFLYGKP